jgi:hypothetical protein
MDNYIYACTRFMVMRGPHMTDHETGKDAGAEQLLRV